MIEQTGLVARKNMFWVILLRTTLHSPQWHQKGWSCKWEEHPRFANAPAVWTAVSYKTVCWNPCENMRCISTWSERSYRALVKSVQFVWLRCVFTLLPSSHVCWGILTKCFLAEQQTEALIRILWTDLVNWKNITRPEEPSVSYASRL